MSKPELISGCSTKGPMLLLAEELLEPFDKTCRVFEKGRGYIYSLQWGDVIQLLLSMGDKVQANQREADAGWLERKAAEHLNLQECKLLRESAAAIRGEQKGENSA